MKIALLAVFAMSIAPVFAQAGPPPTQTFTPKETIASVKLGAVMSDEKALTATAQNTQTNFKEMMAKFQAEYGADQKKADDLSELVRKENGWGPNSVIDRNPQSTTFGKWIMTPQPPPPPPAKTDKPAKKK